MNDSQQSKYVPVISRIIRARRIELGLTMENLGHKMGVCNENVGGAERGTHDKESDVRRKRCLFGQK